MKRLIPALLVSLCSLSAIAGDLQPYATPQWMDVSFSDIEKPDRLSGAEQDQCVSVVLNSLNRTLGTEFTEDDVLPIQMPGWDEAEMGFVRGGGFNVRIGTILPAEDARRINLRSSRFADLRSWETLGAEASLHIPDKIHGVHFFNHTVSQYGDREYYDFIAHVDTAYAYLPVGFLIHMFRDVFGARGRNPCPMDRYQRVED